MVSNQNAVSQQTTNQKVRIFRFWGKSGLLSCKAGFTKAVGPEWSHNRLCLRSVLETGFGSGLQRLQGLRPFAAVSQQAFLLQIVPIVPQYDSIIQPEHLWNNRQEWLFSFKYSIY